ncbi:MAG: FAD-dependent oxidoreductase, partial [Planctomycetota bacterium]
GPYLRDLTRAAAVLVTEEMPVQPLVGWIERLTHTSQTPIAAVDCSCLAPVTALGKLYETASSFRRDAAALHQQQLAKRYDEQPVDCAMCDPEWIEHRFKLKTINLSTANLADLLHLCKIDHSIAPVADTPGGSRAGYLRWETFRQNGLMKYRQARVNPTAAGGSSRMSAYLHYGMVSPFRIAREAAAIGAEKFIDELLVWRELTFHFCFHHRESLDSLDAVPAWAKETLIEHAEDARLKNCSWEKLARGGSEHRLWDAAQRSLLKHGELHNNVRMTWGKAMLPWLSSPLRALQVTFDLNHRYSLDGRNPASYGGILWCYGQFDRPADREQPVYGRLKTRDIESHTKKLDLKQFIKRVDRPIADRLPSVAIVGGGISGLIAARTLQDHGLQVSVFDKARGVGGRTSTRRIQLEDGKDIFFDHGAQYFAARDPRFCRYVQSWIHDGVVAPWLGKLVNLDSAGKLLSEKNASPRYVGTPGMNAIAKHLARDLDVRVSTRITKLQPISNDRWKLISESSDVGDFDLVLASCPATQTAELFAGHTTISEQVRSVRMQPCWTLMLAGDAFAELPFDGAFVQDSPLGWIAANFRKPKRDSTPSLVVQATPQWTEQHIEDSSEDVQTQLLGSLQQLLKINVDELSHQTAHRWMYAYADRSLDCEALFDSVTGLGAFGDWCCGTQVEAAFLSGMAIAGSVLRHYTIDRRPYQEAPTESQPLLFE